MLRSTTRAGTTLPVLGELHAVAKLEADSLEVVSTSEVLLSKNGDPFVPTSTCRRTTLKDNDVIVLRAADSCGCPVEEVLLYEGVHGVVAPVDPYSYLDDVLNALVVRMNEVVLQHQYRSSRQLLNCSQKPKLVRIVEQAEVLLSLCTAMEEGVAAARKQAILSDATTQIPLVTTDTAQVGPCDEERIAHLEVISLLQQRIVTLERFIRL